MGKRYIFTNDDFHVLSKDMCYKNHALVKHEQLPDLYPINNDNDDFERETMCNICFKSIITS